MAGEKDVRNNLGSKSGFTCIIVIILIIYQVYYFMYMINQ